MTFQQALKKLMTFSCLFDDKNSLLRLMYRNDSCRHLKFQGILWGGALINKKDFKQFIERMIINYLVFIPKMKILYSHIEFREIIGPCVLFTPSPQLSHKVRISLCRHRLCWSQFVPLKLWSTLFNPIQ